MASIITPVVGNGGHNSVGCFSCLLFSFFFFFGLDIDVDIDVDTEAVDDDFFWMKPLSGSNINDSEDEVDNAADFDMNSKVKSKDDVNANVNVANNPDNVDVKAEMLLSLGIFFLHHIQ